MKACIRSLALICLFFVCLPALHTPGFAMDYYINNHVFDIPRLDKAVIDADASAWGEVGFRVETLARKSGPVRTASQFDPTFRLAWNDNGLLFLAIVRDTTPVEHASIEELYRKDSIEVFVSAGVGSDNRYQVILAPGADGGNGARVRVYDRRGRPGEVNVERPKIEVKVASRRIKDGYILEALLPILGRDEKGRIAANIVFNDASDAAPGPCSRYSWFPSDTGSVDPFASFALKPSDRASEPIRAAVVRREYQLFRRLQLSVLLRNPENRKTMQIIASSEGAQVATVDVDLSSPPASNPASNPTSTPTSNPALTPSEQMIDPASLREYQITLPMPTLKQPFSRLVLMSDGRMLTPVLLQDISDLRRKALFNTDFFFEKSVFNGNVFPSPDFDSPNRVEDVAGQYSIKTTFYDAELNQVAAPVKPGRYGAVSVVTTTEAGTATYYRTLFRMAGPYEFGSIKGKIELPASVGLDPAIVNARPGEVDYVLDRLIQGNNHGNVDRIAILFCGLAETKIDDPVVDRFDPTARNREWWYRLKKKIGEPTGYPYAIETPNGYDADKEKRWPLLVSLHGAIDRGDDHGDDQLVNEPTWRANSGVIPYSVRTGRRFIIVAPRCTNREAGWSPWQVMKVIDDVCATHRVDPDRIYLTGASMGGFGTWTTAVTFPDRFAAVAPVCGIGDPLDMARLKDLPLWAIHGGKDEWVPIARDQECVDALAKIGGRVRYTFLPNEGHNVPVPNELFDWFLEQRRGSPSQKPAQPPVETKP